VAPTYETGDTPHTSKLSSLEYQSVGGKRQEADIGAAPAGMLDGRALVAAGGAARALPQHVTRRAGAPPDHRHGAGERRA